MGAGVDDGGRGVRVGRIVLTGGVTLSGGVGPQPVANRIKINISNGRIKTLCLMDFGSFFEVFIISTHPIQRARFTKRISGFADFPAKANKVQMNWVICFRLKLFSKILMGLVGTHLLRPDTESTCDSVYMGIHRKRRHI